MQKLNKKSIYGWAIFILFAGIFFELLLDWGRLIPFVIGIYFVYHELKNKRQKSAIMIIGIALMSIPLLTTSFFFLAIILVIGYWLYHYYQLKNTSKKITVQTIEPVKNNRYFTKKPLFQNRIWNTQQEVKEVYEWNDINIQCGFGDTEIDLGMTVLPLGESTVMIRSFIGNIIIYVPFDVEVIVNHSTVSGSIKVFDDERTIFNESMVFKPTQNEDSIRTIKIFTTLFIGNVEVRRV